MPLEGTTRLLVAAFFFLAFASATHDAAVDGFYLIALDEHGQAFFAGIRGTFYRIATVLVQGALVMLAGWVESRTGEIRLRLVRRAGRRGGGDGDSLALALPGAAASRCGPPPAAGTGAAEPGVSRRLRQFLHPAGNSFTAVFSPLLPGGGGAARPDRHRLHAGSPFRRRAGNVGRGVRAALRHLRHRRA
ncbi:MAG: hypothetical protein L6W00_08115 [Lentisphaeria bacterium]|nr:MAG: hypothetical protein L6W00_08115 [Lentisphaeria bacterium]